MLDLLHLWPPVTRTPSIVTEFHEVSVSADRNAASTRCS